MGRSEGDTEHTPCLEIAVYDVHAADADGFPARQAAMHAALQTLPGSIRSERLRGLSTPTLFADYITWASRQAAEAAAAEMTSLPDAGTFLAAIATMRTFTHLPMTTPPRALVALERPVPHGHTAMGVATHRPRLAKSTVPRPERPSAVHRVANRSASRSVMAANERAQRQRGLTMR